VGGGWTARGTRGRSSSAKGQQWRPADSVLARGEAMAPFIGRALACDDRMTAKMPPWYGDVSAGAQDRGRTGGPLGACVRRGRRARREAGRN
jgi:hypothetical protein